ncbi:MAG TPA: VWA domain-containing protein [Dongiaceae bacterium]|nr:VWA domain-containing protein [Dongiaceae bacterium]
MLILLKMWWPLVLLPLPWILRRLLPRASRGDSGLLRVPFFDAIDELAHRRERNRSARSWYYRLLLLTIWVSLVIAACGPTYIGDPITVRDKARDLMFAVDVSGSMQMTDLTLRGEQVDRLTVIKDVLNEFIDRRNGDRMGLILFGSQAYLQTPLTFDRPTLKQLLFEAQIGIAGPNTAIGDAIGLALKRLKDRPNESKVLIVLTDGANTAGEISPIQAAQLAKAKGLKIYTIGVGADEMVMPGLLGTRLGARRINPSADLDEETLSGIAQLTDGQYFRAKSTDSLRQIYRMLDKLEPVESDPETFRPVRSLFYYPLGLALLLSAGMALRSLIDSQLARRSLKAREQADLLNEAAP